jgi:AcrR family transcriptional regulator
MKKATGPTWRERERIRTKKQILAAARNVFARKGFHKSSLSEIASEAGLGKATLYSYFADKADLVRAVFEDTIDEQLRTVERAVSGKRDPRSRIRAIATAQLRHFAKHRYLLRICATENLFQSEELKRDIRTLMMQKYAKYTELLEETFALAAKKGLLKKTDPRQVAHLFIAILHAVSLYWHMYGVKPSPEDEGRMVCDIVFDGLRKA